MAKKLRIALIWDWKPSFYQTITWQDGLAAALKELINRGHGVTVYTDTKFAIPHPYFTIHPIDLVDIKGADVILHFADMTRPHAAKTAQLGMPMALCFTGGEVRGENLQYFDHIFVESWIYKARFEKMGKSVSTAFGTNTELFKPLTEQSKQFDSIFPATFAAWKRHELYAKATEGLRSLAVGYMYSDHEQECWQVCLDHGVTILPHVSGETLRYLYAASKVCVIPSLSSGGSQRTVLEAMAMNLPVVITDSDKFDWAHGHVAAVEPTIQAVRQEVDNSLGIEVNTRDYILENWSEFTYADALEAGLRAIV